MNNSEHHSLSMIINYDKKLIKKFRKLTEKVLHSDINHNKKQEYLEQFRDGVNGTKFNALYDSSISQSLLPSPKFYNTSFFSEKEDYSTYKTLTANSIDDDTLVESNRIFLKNKQIEAKFKENKKEKIVNKLEEIKTNLIEIECPNCAYLNHPIMIKCETRLTILSINDPDYIKFRNILISEIPKSNVKGVIKIDMPTKLLKNHEKYKKNISKKTGLPLEKITHQVFHGTTTRFGCNPERFLVNHNFYNENYDCKFCKKGCGMCGILQYGNKKQLSKHSKKMWFAHSTLVSRHYTGFNSIKVMFVVEVVSKDNNWILVVRKNKATLPKFMIIFEQ
ncbi:9302_t:CDS:2 [Entrophospora sp. SA101]|nr:9302_t:CDS:2 [Entrophospora sp. SA101]CAJ0857100.1 6435_t:CDS:2 [Entrophospora sp. SA101]